MTKYLIIIGGMTLVTYIPRLLPLAALSDKKLPTWLKKFLLLIPFTTLGALIFPDILQATPEKPHAALAGAAAAVLISWFKGGLIFPVLVSIIATLFMLYFG